jgi:hypothetical protein
MNGRTYASAGPVTVCSVRDQAAEPFEVAIDTKA